MKLTQYFQLTKTTAGDLAQKIGVSPSTIWRLANGETQPTWRKAKAIAEATGGAVMPNDFLSEKEGKSK